jgi:hypothetical protein
MKYSILILTAASFFFSCSEDNNVQFTITPELTSYVDAFYSEASLRNVNPPKNNLIAQIGQCQAITDLSKDDEQWILTFDKEHFENYSSAKIEAIVFHELGKIILGREIIKTTLANDPNPISIMNPYYKFGYKVEQRAALLDELFQ